MEISNTTEFNGASLVDVHYESFPMQDAPQTLSEKAHRALSRMIQERELPSGKLIVESHLAEKLGVKSYKVFIKLNINLRYGGPVSKGGDFQLRKKCTC